MPAVESDVPPLTAGLLLAAGQGRRLGRGPKAFVQLGGETLLERAVARLRRVGVDAVVAVLPPGPDPVPLPADLIVVRNPRPETGPLGSACLGVAALPEACRFALLYPVDHHAVTDEDVSQILGAVEGAPPTAARIVPRFDGRGGHPVLLLPSALMALRAVADPASSTLREVLDEAGTVVHVEGVGSGVQQNLNFAADLPHEGGPLATEAQ